MNQQLTFIFNFHDAACVWLGRGDFDDGWSGFFFVACGAVVGFWGLSARGWETGNDRSVFLAPWLLCTLTSGGPQSC